jgi:hypothetical protein
MRRIVGVYDADGTPWGELSYWIGARLGRRHCALCDITHGSVRERPEWRRCADDLPVPFEAFHRNDVPPHIAAAVTVAPPYVVAEADDGAVTLLLDGDDLEACAGSPEALVDALCGRLPAGDATEEGGVADGEA